MIIPFRSQAGEANGVDGASIGERVVDLSGFDDSSTGSEWEDIGKRCDTPATAWLQLRAETCHGTRK